MTPSIKPSSSPLSAGGEIDAWCTKCRMDLGHRIVAMVGSAPKRVMCMTCNSEHNYRATKNETEKKAATKKAATGTKSKTGRKTGAVAAREEWETRVHSGAALTRYTIHQTFQTDELITHKKFGDGFVISVNTSGKITVAFVDGERILVHGLPE